MAEPARYDKDDEKPVIKPDLKVLEGGKKKGTTPNKTTKKDKVTGGALKAAEAKATGGVLGKGEGDQVGSGFNPLDSERNSRIKQFLSLDKGQRKKALIGGGVIGGIVVILVALFAILIPLKIESIVNNIENRFFASAEKATEDQTEKMFSGYIKRVLKNYPGKGCTSTLVDKNCIPSFNGKNPVDRLYNTWSQARIETKLAEKYGLEFKWDPASNTYYIKTGLESDATAESTSRIPTNDITGANALGSDIFDDITNSQGFATASRSDIRLAFRNAIKDETLMNRVLLHFQFGRLMEEKYGEKRCIIFCTGKDQLSTAVESGKNAAKILFVSRVIQPRFQALGQAMICLFDDSCKAEATRTATDDSVGDAGLDGTPEAEIDTTIRGKLQTLFAQFGSEDPAAMVKLFNDIQDAGGYQSYMIQQVMDILFNVEISDTSAKTIGHAIPVLGWINMASQVVILANQAGPKLKKLSYIVGAGSAVSMYMLYRSYADEVKTGQANSTEVGQFTDTLGPTAPTTSTTDPNVGGTASAEQTPLYGQLIDGGQPLSASTSSLLNNILPGQAYATTPAITTNSSYKCNDGQSPGSSQDPGIVCNEEILGRGNGVFNLLHDILSNWPGFSIIGQLAQAWSSSIGKLFNFLGDIVSVVVSPLLSAANLACDAGSIPIIGGVIEYSGPWAPYCEVRDIASTVGKDLMSFATQELFPNPFGTNMSGGRSFDEMAIGGDVSGNDLCHTGLGCAAASNQQVLGDYNEQQQEAQYAFKNESFFARMFDTTSQYSLITKLAVAMPTDVGSSVQSTLGSFLQDPLGGLAHGVAALFSIGKVNAAAPITSCPGDTSATAQYDDFACVTQYAYPSSGPNAMPTDPDTYWNQNCNDNPNVDDGQMTTNWNNAVQNADNESDPSTALNYQPAPAGGATAFSDPNSGEGVNTTTDPCLLIQSSVGSAGGLFDTSLLTPDDLADTSNTSTASNGQNVVAQAVEPSSHQPTEFFAILFHNLGSVGKTIDRQFKDLNVLWAIKWRYHDH